MFWRATRPVTKGYVSAACDERVALTGSPLLTAFTLSTTRISTSGLLPTLTATSLVSRPGLETIRRQFPADALGIAKAAAAICTGFGAIASARTKFAPALCNPEESTTLPVRKVKVADCAKSVPGYTVRRKNGISAFMGGHGNTKFTGVLHNTIDMDCCLVILSHYPLAKASIGGSRTNLEASEQANAAPVGVINGATRTLDGVAQEFKLISVKGVASQLGYDADLAAIVVPVLAVEIVGQKMKFIDRTRPGTTGVPPFMCSCTSMPHPMKPFEDSCCSPRNEFLGF